MNTLTVMVAIWGLAVAAFVGLMIYRAQLAQYETDQLFLSETAPTTSHEENDDIIRRVQRLEPFCKGAGGAAAAATVLVIGTWVVQELSRNHIL